MPYTIADDPETVARIEQDLDHIQETVRRHDPHLRALVLTGGFARGEGAVRDGRPQNDYDLVAVRDRGRSEVPYDRMRRRLEHDIDLHLDLAPVPTWRLPLASPSIFWYETALRGKVLWGDALLDRIPVRDARMIPPVEGLRLLVNRAAGLLIATQTDETDAIKVQAAKGLLAAMDAHLLADGRFAPSQTERWRLYRALHDRDDLPSALTGDPSWFSWAYRYKTDPDQAPTCDPHEAWSVAARAILDAVPPALDSAGFGHLDAFRRADGVVDHAYWFLRSRNVPHARRLALNPTGQVRVATLRLLERAANGGFGREDAEALLAGVVHQIGEPVDDLERLRQATLQ